MMFASDWLSRVFVRIVPTAFPVVVLAILFSWLTLAKSAYLTVGSRDPASPRQEPMAVSSLGVALILTFLCLGSDVLWVLHQMGLLWLERVVWAAAFLVALALLILSWRRERRYSSQWRGRYVRIVTACVLGLNVAIAIVARSYGAL